MTILSHRIGNHLRLHDSVLWYAAALLDVRSLLSHADRVCSFSYIFTYLPVWWGRNIVPVAKCKTFWNLCRFAAKLVIGVHYFVVLLLNQGLLISGRPFSHPTPPSHGDRHLQRQRDFSHMAVSERERWSVVSL